jgi:hypothetical protein
MIKQSNHFINICTHRKKAVIHLLLVEEKKYLTDKEIVQEVPSFYGSSDDHEPTNFCMTHAILSNSFHVHKEEHVDIEPLTEEIFKEDLSELLSLGSPLDSNKETTLHHQNQEVVSSDNGDIKIIFEVDIFSVSATVKVRNQEFYIPDAKWLDKLMHVLMF